MFDRSIARLRAAHGLAFAMDGLKPPRAVDLADIGALGADWAQMSLCFQQDGDEACRAFLIVGVAGLGAASAVQTSDAP